MTQNMDNVGWEENLFKPVFFAPSMCMTSIETSHGDVANISKQKSESDVSPQSELTDQDTQVCPVLKFIVGCEDYCAKKSILINSEAKKLDTVKNFDSKIFEMFNFTRQPVQSREGELVREIERAQARLKSVTEQLQISIAERENLECKIKGVEDKIRNQTKTLDIPVSDNPSKNEIQYLEKLTEMAREKARRSRVLKALEEKEDLLKQYIVYYGHVDSTTPANIPMNNPTDFRSMDFLREFENSMKQFMRGDPSCEWPKHT